MQRNEIVLINPKRLEARNLNQKNKNVQRYVSLSAQSFTEGWPILHSGATKNKASESIENEASAWNSSKFYSCSFLWHRINFDD